VCDRNVTASPLRWLIAHRVRSYRGRQGFLEHLPLTTVKVAMPQPSPRRGEGESAVPMDSLATQRSCLKSSSHRRVAV